VDLNSALNPPKGSRRLPEVLTTEEQSALLSAPNKKVPTGMRNYALLLVFLNLGLRVSESLNLRVDDIDWLSGRLIVRQGKGNRDRVLWLADRDIGTLKGWISMRSVESVYLFSTLKGDRMNDRYIRDFVKRYGRKMNIKKDVHPHTLRHSFATDLLRSTANIRLVQKALGHVSIATTMIYTHIVDEQLESALKGFRNK
jgi:site-specific recombinase XerD